MKQTPQKFAFRFSGLCRVAAAQATLFTLLLVPSGIGVSAAEVPGDPEDNGGYLPEDSMFVPSPATDPSVGNNNPQPGFHDNGRGGNSFVNDPCIDPPPPSTRRTVQSETTIATFGKYMVAGFNDSFGFYDNTQGLSGFSYTLNGGNTWIDGGGLPPLVPSPTLFTTVGPDRYFGDPVTVVDKSARTFTTDSNGNPLPQPISQPAGTFYYSSLYSPPANPFPGGAGTISVNRGVFLFAPPTTPETAANTRCYNHPELQGIPDNQHLPSQRIVWDKPVIAVPFQGPTQFDFLDKEQMWVDQGTGTLYLVYVRFANDLIGSTPVELVRSFDGGRTWTPPSTVVPNEADAFNTGTYVLTVPKPAGGTRVLVFWWRRQFDLISGATTNREIQYAISDDNGSTFGPQQTIAEVYRESTAPGYNRPRTEILNAVFAATRNQDVYVTYYSGKFPGNPPATGGPSGPRPSDIFVNASHDGGTTFGPQVKVNDDIGQNVHLFSGVQVNKNGWVYVGWLDRRNDPNDELTDAWAAVSKDAGASFGHNKVQTDVATSWRVRADAQPNFGDYNTTELLNDNQFLMIWADGRFPGGTFIPATCTPAPPPGQQCPPRLSATPDSIFTIANGLGVGN
jgi:hypothetical protein